MKKLVSLILAIAMICAMSVTVFADEPAEGKTVRIENATKERVYALYQIFTGKVAPDGDKLVLSDILYGKNFGTEGDEPDPTVLDTYLAMNGADLAKLLKPLVHGEYITLNEGNNWEATGLATGYYLIDDITPADKIPDGQTRSRLMLEVVENVNVTSKHAGLTTEKKVAEVNDSVDTDDTPVWLDSADYDKGDTVRFQISAILPSTFTHYDTYEMTFHDQQAPGFGPATVTDVYVVDENGDRVVDITLEEGTDYTVEAGCTNRDTCEFALDNDGINCSFHVNFADLRVSIPTYQKNYKVVVEYNAVLENPAIGIQGNENAMYVCHPDGHTPIDTVIVYSYQLTADKVDGQGNELEGAEFELQKWDAKTSTWVSVNNRYTKEDKTLEGTRHIWTGLDEGKYKLIETKTPDTFNTMPPREILITSALKTTWTKGLDGSAFEDLVTDGNIFSDYNDAKADPKDGKLIGDVVNNKGAVLPETGAMGTMIFITTGAILTMAAVVFMVTRKKMTAYED